MSGCKAKSEICPGKNAVGRRSAISGIALQRKGEGHQRCEARANAALIEPSSDFFGCCRHCSLALRSNIDEDGFYTPDKRGSSLISSFASARMFTRALA